MEGEASGVMPNAPPPGATTASKLLQASSPVCILITYFSSFFLQHVRKTHKAQILKCVKMCDGLTEAQIVKCLKMCEGRYKLCRLYGKP